VARALAGAAKKGVDEHRPLVFIDESGFYLLPGMVATYAPIGQTPVLSVPLTRDHLSVIGALTPEGRLLTQIQDHAFKSADVISFLEHLLEQIPGKLLVIWEGAPLHRSKAIGAYLAQGAAARLWLERFPGYAPDLNPTEGIGRYLKVVELKNLCCRDLLHLTEALH